MKYKLVVVEWVDSVQPVPSWRAVDDIEPGEHVKVLTAGWLIHKTKSSLTIAQQLGDGPPLQASGVVVIPRVSVVKVYPVDIAKL